MPRHWTGCIRSASRDADWTSAGPRAFESAVLRDVRELLAHPGVERVLRQLEGAQQPVLRPGGLLPRVAGNRLLDLSRDHLDRCYALGLRGRELLREALGAALVEDLAAKRREMAAHVATRHFPSVREIQRRLGLACANAADAGLAVLLGSSARESPRSALDMDGDLIGGLR